MKTKTEINNVIDQATDLIEDGLKSEDNINNQQRKSKMEDLIMKIVQLAESSGILKEATPATQAIKTMQKLGKLAHAISENDDLKIADAIGGVAFTLIIQAKICGIKSFYLPKQAENLTISKAPALQIQHTFLTLNKSIGNISITISQLIKYEDKVCFLTSINSFMDQAITDLNFIALQNGANLHECLQIKSQKVLKLKGKMVNGFFVKDASTAQDVYLDDTVRLPHSLTAENGAKKILIGEFHETLIVKCQICDDGIFDETETCDECDGAGNFEIKVPINWATIKEIYAMIVKNMAINPPQP